MTSEQNYIVQTATGRKSRPTTRPAILRMLAAGKIPEPAFVTIPGREFRIPIEQFADDQLFMKSLLLALPNGQGNSVPEAGHFDGFTGSVPPIEETGRNPADSAPGNLPVIIASSQKASRPKSREPFWRMLFVLALIVVAVGSVTLNRRFLSWLNDVPLEQVPIAPLVPGFIQGDEMKSAVREYLAENLHSGDWDEVRWYPPFTLKHDVQWSALHAAALAVSYSSIHLGNETFSAWAGLRQRVIPGREPRYIRLKYRTQNSFGAQQLFDTAFEVSSGKAIPVTQILQYPFCSSWAALVAGENGIKVEVVPDDAAAGAIRGNEAMIEGFLRLKDGFKNNP